MVCKVQLNTVLVILLSEHSIIVSQDIRIQDNGVLEGIFHIRVTAEFWIRCSNVQLDVISVLSFLSIDVSRDLNSLSIDIENHGLELGNIARIIADIVVWSSSSPAIHIMNLLEICHPVGIDSARQSNGGGSRVEHEVSADGNHGIW